MKERDKTLDNLRGFAMLQVIIVHVLYWGDFFTSSYINLIKSFCLFEMPVLFFVTGASNARSKDVPYIEYVKKRYLKLLIPYWTFAIICAALSIAKYIIVDDQIDGMFFLKVILSWILPVNRQITSISYLTWALWFVPVYLCVVLFIPWLKELKRATNIYIYYISSVLRMGWIQYVLFYLIWVYVGLFYEELKNIVYDIQARKKIFALSVVSILLLLILSFWDSL